MTSLNEKRSDRQRQIEEYVLGEGKKQRGQEVVTKSTERKLEKEIDKGEHEVDDMAAGG